MAVDAVIRGVELPTDVPFGEWGVGPVKRFFERLEPVDHVGSDFGPELIRIRFGLIPDLLVLLHARNMGCFGEFRGGIKNAGLVQDGLDGA